MDARAASRILVQKAKKLAYGEHTSAPEAWINR